MDNGVGYGSAQWVSYKYYEESLEKYDTHGNKVSEGIMSFQIHRDEYIGSSTLVQLKMENLKISAHESSKNLTERDSEILDLPPSLAASGLLIRLIGLPIFTTWDQKFWFPGSSSIHAARRS